MEEKLAQLLNDDPGVNNRGVYNFRQRQEGSLLYNIDNSFKFASCRANTFNEGKGSALPSRKITFTFSFDNLSCPFQFCSWQRLQE